jgi:exosortase A-associated hydrolase 1
MRFDYRGMGDSAGQFRGFEDVGADIAAAIDAFARAVPGIERVVLWGLCDGASAIMFYAHRDPRVAGLAVLNPWVRTEAGLAKAQLKHYYLRRLLDGQSWRRLLTGRLSVGRSLAGVAGTVRSAMDDSGVSADSALPDRMAAGLSQFRGPVLLVLSGNDLTAREFEDAVSGSAVWRRLLGLEWVRRHDLPGADHTLSRREWRDQVTDWTIAWAKSL